MTKREFDKLQPGDVVQSALSGESYVIVVKSDVLSGYIAVRHKIITHSDEWILVKKDKAKK